MIVWPEEKRLTKASRDALARFRETAASAELEDATERWTIVTLTFWT